MIQITIPTTGHAQSAITSDGTVGTTVTFDQGAYTISAGTVRGTNQFHSFGRFNVPTDQSATFTGPSTIENIIGRVTGGELSSIDGLIESTIDGANLFLANPYGILFGPNARLDVQGSFHATTADYIRLADGGIFYANPGGNTTLSVAPPEAFGFLNENPTGISLQASILEVPDGTTLSLVGGDIRIVGGELSTWGGRINLVSVASPGEVTSNIQVDSFEQFGEIDVSQDAYVSTSGNPAGTIFIRGENLTIDDSSFFSSLFGWLDGGRIDIGLTGDLLLTNSGSMSASSFVGRASDISVEAQTATIRDGGYIATQTDSIGDAGDISLTLASLAIEDGGKLYSATFGAGDAGDLTVTATGSVLLSGDYFTRLSTDAFEGSGNAGDISLQTPVLTMAGGVISAIGSFGEGRAGNISIDVGTLELTKGALIASDTFVGGDGGNLTVNATESVFISDPFSALQSNSRGTGDSGSISLSTPSLTIQDEGLIQAASYEGGNSGDINIEVTDLTLANGGQISNDTLFTIDGTGHLIPSTGQGGNITVTATGEVLISNQSSAPYVRSSISSTTFGNGNAGDITISTPTLMCDNGVIEAQAMDTGSGWAGDINLDVGSLTIINGGQISAPTYSTGQGGSVEVAATESVSISGRRSYDGFESGFSCGTYGAGDAGMISISTPVLSIDEGIIEVLTAGGGNSGNISLQVGSLTLSGGAGIYADSLSTGQGGSIEVTGAESVSISGQNTSGTPSAISSGTLGAGKGGMISISAPVLSVDAGLIEVSTSGDGDAGNTFVRVASLSLTGGAQIESNSESSGNAGNVTIAAAESISISGEGSGVFSAAESSGAGGDITLQARNVQLGQGGIVSAKSSGPGDAGDIDIAARDTLVMRDSSITTEAAQADGGNIKITSDYMVRLGDSEITASVGGGPDTVGGNIDIDPDFVILRNSNIVANAFEGRGGNIRIAAGVFLADPNSVIDASSDKGIDGTVDIRAPIKDVSQTVKPPPKKFKSATELIRESCIERIRGGQYSSFVVSGRDGLPIEPDGLLPGILYLQ